MTPQPVVDTVPRSYEEYRQRRDRIGPGALDEAAYNKVMTRLKNEVEYLTIEFTPDDANEEIANLNLSALKELGLIRPSYARGNNSSPAVFEIANFLDARMPNQHTEVISADAYPSSIKVDTNTRIITGLPEGHELIAFGRFQDGRDFVVHRFYDNSDPQKINELIRADIGEGGELTSHHARALRSPDELSVFVSNIGVIIIPHNTDHGEFVPDGAGRPFPIPRLYRQAANLP